MKILITSVMVAVAAVAIGLLSPSAYADSVFTPATGVRMCNAQALSFTDPQLAGVPTCADILTNSTATDTTITVDLAGTNVNFASQVTFMPAGTTTSAGGSIPAGTKLGSVRAIETYSITNAPCSSSVLSDFILFNVALPNNPGTPLSSTNLVYPQVQGTVDRFAKWKVGSAPGGADPSGINPGVDVAHAAGTSLAFQDYPRYLLDAFNNLIPVAAYGGLTQIEGEWSPLYLLQFNAGQLASIPGAYSLMNVAMGPPMVWVRGDPTTTLPSPSNITDVCAPMSTTTVLLGKDPSAVYTRATTLPTAGTAYYMQYLASLRDTDQDGFENAIDTCPLNPDVGSPKTGTGDADGDGIDDSCDAAPSPFPNDTDLDGYINRRDNCPQVVNTTQLESEVATASDRGTKTDQIGDPCETGPITITQNGSSVTITPSTTVANGRYMTRTNVVPKCFATADADADGYCGAADPAATEGGGVCATTTPNSCAVRHDALNVGSTNPILQMDTDGDTLIPSLPATIVSNWSDAMETYMGTDATKPCAQTVGADSELPLDNWPLDLNDARNVGGADWLRFANFVLATSQGGNRPINVNIVTANGTPTTPATITIIPFMGVQSQQRFDFNHDGFLNGADLGKFNSYMNKTCGAAGAPPTTLGGTFQP